MNEDNMNNKDVQLEEILKQLQEKSERDPMRVYEEGIQQSFIPSNDAPVQGAFQPQGAVQGQAPAPPAGFAIEHPAIPNQAAAIPNEMYYRPQTPQGYAPQTPQQPAPPKPPQQRTTAQINKRMLAPTIESGSDWQVERRDAAPRPQAQYLYKNPSEHPVFTETFPANRIPIANTAPPRKLPRTETGLVDRTRMVREMEDYSEPGMNVGEKAADEEFRDFFGDTTVMQGKKPRGTRPVEPAVAPRPVMPARVARPVVTAVEELERPMAPPAAPVVQPNMPPPAFSGGEQQVPVFDEPEYDDGALTEYRSDNDTDWFMGRLMSDLGGCTLRTVITAVIDAALLFFCICGKFFPSVTASLAAQPPVYCILMAGLVLAAAGINYRSVFGGFFKLVTFRANKSSVTSFAVIAALIQSIVLLLSGAASVEPTAFAGCAAVSSLLASAVGDRMTAKRILDNFKNVSDGYDKYATAPLFDAQITNRITRELEAGIGNVLVKRKTAFTDDFMYHSFSEDELNTQTLKAVPFVFIASILCGVVAFIKTRQIADAMTFMALAAAFSSPFLATLASELPFSNLQKKLSSQDAFVPGYSAVDEITSCNCVLLEGRDVFPKENVMLHGIKTFERERIDMAILYASSVLIQSCDTLSGVFLNVIQNKTDILFEVEGIVYEDGRGYSFWVGKNRVLLGTRELMSEHEIEVPSRDYENRYTKKSTRDAIYLSVSGKLFAMFIVSYEPNAEIEEVFHGFEREGISVLVRTRDFNVTPNRISRLYGIPRSMVSIVREADLADLAKHTSYAQHTSSALTFSGKLMSFFKGIVLCYGLRSTVKLSSTLELANMLSGATLALALSVWGALAGLGALTALLFNAAWLAALAVIVLVKKD